MNLLSPRREVGEFKKHYKWMALAAVIAFAGLFLRAANMELLDYERWQKIATENITKTITLPATRGLLRDTAGRIVATNRPAYNVYLTPQLLDPVKDVPRLAELMSLDGRQKAELEARLAAIPLHRRTHQVAMFRDITRDQLASLEQHEAELKGVDVVAEPVRMYPFGPLAAHAIGYLNEVNAEDLERAPDQGYRAGDTVGRSGIERAWESYVRGRRGVRRVIVEARGQRRDEEHTERPHETRREPVPGRDLTLTLDMELMRITERAFRGHPSGGAVVVDVRTGRVRALFSKPSYDLNELAGRLSHDRAREIIDNPLRPLIDKTIYESYFPGSTFKVISALAALGGGVLDANSHIDCPGYYEYGGRRFRCLQQHGDVDMHQSIVRSCNTFFYDLARQVGMDRLAHMAREFGLGERTGIGINTETSGFIPTVSWYQEHYPHGFRGGFTLNEAIGQGNTKVTLMQLAMAYAAIANGGTLYVPQLIERVSGPDGTLIEEFQPRVRHRVDVSRENLTYVIDGLYGVVNDRTGTAYAAHVEGGVPIAGKTGTAQVSGRAARDDEDPRQTWYYNRSHAWFAGFAPAGNPELVVIVLIEHGGGGGKNAAPIGIQILQEYLGPRYAAQQQAAAAEAAAAAALANAPRGGRGRAGAR